MPRSRRSTWASTAPEFRTAPRPREPTTQTSSRSTEGRERHPPARIPSPRRVDLCWPHGRPPGRADLPRGPPRREPGASGCGGVATVIHGCGAPVCMHCIAEFRTCPKCGQPVALPARPARTGGRRPGPLASPVGLVSSRARGETCPIRPRTAAPSRNRRVDSAASPSEIRPRRTPPRDPPGSRRPPREAPPGSPPAAADRPPAPSKPPRPPRERTDDEPRLPVTPARGRAAVL